MVADNVKEWQKLLLAVSLAPSFIKPELTILDDCFCEKGKNHKGLTAYNAWYLICIWCETVYTCKCSKHFVPWNFWWEKILGHDEVGINLKDPVILPFDGPVLF